MEDVEPAQPPPEGSGTPERATPKVRSEEALARSKEEVTPFFKQPRAPKKPGRWSPGRTIGNRPSK